jgi:hypothetical protein
MLTPGWADLEYDRPGLHNIADPGVPMESIQPLAAETAVKRDAAPGAVDSRVGAEQGVEKRRQRSGVDFRHI